MKCSFIVSAWNRPASLACVLRSLVIQTETDFEVLVTDNALTEADATGNVQAVAQLQDARFRYERTDMADCYVSANHGAAVARGEYLCFPSDDDYYTPRFLELMLKGNERADLIYCNCIYNGNGCHYAPMEVEPVCGRIDKGGFLVRRSKFPEFTDGTPGTIRAADGWMIERLVRSGIQHHKVPGYLWIHN
jgi:glycosyltransferase involved in cell wall biosynthesis